MLMKSADDKSRRLKLLEDLQQSKQLDYRQKKWLREELHRCSMGIRGERDSAHYLDNYFKDKENHVLLLDLRFVVDGDVAQIDHLILNRVGHMILVETKNHAGSLTVNAHGEFTVHYEQDSFGIPSPWEQSRRHERILARLLERLEITGRLDKQPEFHHVVMLHPKAVITRPDAAQLDTSYLIKADQFPSWHEKFAKQVGATTLLKAMFNVRSMETITAWAEKLKRQHRPADALALPDFMQPTAPTPAPAPRVAPIAQAALAQTPPLAAPAPDAPAKKLVCAHCGAKISYPEGKYCWNNSQRFNGLQYCREHQGLF